MIDRRRLRLRGSSGRVGLRAVFAQPGYRRLWSARTVSQWGDVFATVALVLLVFDLTGSALGVSAVVFAEIAPVLLLGPFAGTLVDSVAARRLLRWSRCTGGRRGRLPALGLLAVLGSESVADRLGRPTTSRHGAQLHSRR